MPPWNPKAAALVAYQLAEEKAGRPGRLFANCLPEAMAGWMLVTHNAMESLFTPGRVTMLGESDGNRLRRIYTDGRPHPDDPDPTWLGHSIGHWEGDTLVVDTVGFNGRAWIDLEGHPFTDNTHIIERWRRPNLGHLEVECTIDDASTYVKPWSIKRILYPHLAGSGGMAASLLAMNEIFGRFFSVDPIEMFEPEAYAQSGTPRALFVFDDQLHLVRGTMDGPLGLRGLAQGPTSGGSTNEYNPKGLPDEHGKVWAPWNPALVGLPNTRANLQIVRFIKDVYLDSQINIGLLSNVTGSVLNVLGGSEPVPTNVRDARRGEMLTADQTVAARNFINEISGSTRMLAHGLLYVGKGNLDYIQEQTERNAPDSWKGYNISESAKVDNNPNSPLRQWRHDDENVAYPTFELIQKYYAKLKDKKPGFNNICVHKGLVPPQPADPEHGHPADLPKAAKDWPNLNFITYHACIRPLAFLYDSWQEVKSGKLRKGVPDID